MACDTRAAVLVRSEGRNVGRGFEECREHMIMMLLVKQNVRTVTYDQRAGRPQGLYDVIMERCYRNLPDVVHDCRVGKHIG